MMRIQMQQYPTNSPQLHLDLDMELLTVKSFYITHMMMKIQVTIFFFVIPF